MRGTISFTFDASLCRVTVRIRHDLPVDAVFAAILAANDDIDVKQVIKTADGKEEFIEPNISRENQPHVPGYLDEDDEYDEATLKRTAVERKGAAGSRVRRAATTTAAVDDSDSEEPPSNGWFGSIGSYISRSIWG